MEAATQPQQAQHESILDLLPRQYLHFLQPSVERSSLVAQSVWMAQRRPGSQLPQSHSLVQVTFVGALVGAGGRWWFPVPQLFCVGGFHARPILNPFQSSRRVGHLRGLNHFWFKDRGWKDDCAIFAEALDLLSDQHRVRKRACKEHVASTPHHTCQV